MTEPGNPDPNAPGWGSMPGYGQQQPPAPPGWGPPPPGQGGYGGGYGAPPPGYGGYGGGYGGPPYGYYGAPPTDGKAIGALVSSIVAWVACPFVAAIVALVLASQSSRAIRDSGGRLQGEGFNTAAKIISWINIAGCLFFLLIFIAAAASVDETTYDTEFGACHRVTVEARQVPC